MTQTNAEYLKSKGLVCPECGSSHVWGADSMQPNGNTAWQKVVCNDCRSTWEDVYQLVGYANLKVGGE